MADDLSTPDFVTALASAREEAAVLRRNRAAFSPDRVEEILDTMATAAEEWTTFVSEKEAMTLSGLKLRYFRQRFPDWQRRGHARFNPHNAKERQYLLAVIPREADIDAVRAAARRAAEELHSLRPTG